MRPLLIARLAAIPLALAGCSQAGVSAPPKTEPSSRPAPAKTPAAAPVAGQATSRVLGKTDVTLRGKPACDIRFVYAGRDAENLFWEEPCGAVTATMMGRRELEGLGRWSRLDSFARRFVTALPGGKVLYVEGGFSASIYPVGTTGSTYEVPVAD